MEDILVYFGLFWNAFIAATILPAFSEVTLIGLLANNIGVPLLLFFAATTGNVAGSIVNWWLGKNIARFESKRWFPIKQEKLKKAEKLFAKYGIWTLLLAWAPIIGDPITLVAGMFRARLLYFIILVTIGKAARYGFIVLTYQAL